MYSLKDSPRAIALGLTLLLCTTVHATTHPTLDRLWGEAVESLKSSNHQRASDLFQNWIDEASSQELVSSEAFANLAFAEWHLERRDKAAYHYLQSSLASRFPWQAAQKLTFFHEIEKHLGVKESAHKDKLFSLRVLFTDNTMTLIFSLSFWGILLLLLVKWWQHERALDTSWFRPLLVLPLGLLVVGLLGAAAREWGPEYAILQGSNEVPIYSVPREDEKLVELPTGTVVQTGRSEGDYLQMTEPVSGWVKKERLQVIAFRLSN